MGKIGRQVSWVLIFSLSLCAELLLGASLTGELDKTEGTLEDQFLYSLSIQGNFDGEPSLPPVDGLEIERTGTSQSVSIINGKFSREVQVQFVIRPQKAGVFVIPSVKLRVDKQELQTVPLEFKVLGSGGSGGTSPGAAQTADRTVYLEREFDRTKIYVGESLVAKIRLFNRVKLYGASPQIDYPSSFQQKPMGDQLNYQRTIQGEDYSVTELRTLLTPTKPGIFDILPALVEAQVPGTRRPPPRSFLDDWVSGGARNLETKRYRTESAKVEVLALPLQGRRADFSGLVGRFTLQAELSQQSIPLGDTVTLTLRIQGQGATVGMVDPELTYPDKAKVYRDKPQSQDTIDPDRGLLGDRTYKFALVPTRPGLLELGSLTLQIFDPELGNYRDLTVALGKIQVEASPSSQGESSPTISRQAEQGPSAQPVATLGEDLVEPHGIERLEGSDQLSSQQWYVGLLLMAGVSLLVPLVALRKYWQATADQRTRRRKQSQAFRVFRVEQALASKLLLETGPKEAIHHARQSLHTYLADKLAVKATTMTAKDLAVCLQSKGIDGETVGAMKELWDQMDQVLYAKKVPRPEECRELLGHMDRVVGEVDHRC